jgi:hypothetical protein
MLRLKSSIGLLCILWFGQLPGQETHAVFQPSFYQHLLSHQLYQEAYHYLSLQPGLADSLILDQSILFRQLHKSDSGDIHMLRTISRDPVLRPDRQKQYLGLLFEHRQKDLLLYLSALPSFASRKTEIQLSVSMLNQQKLTTTPDSLSSVFIDLTHKYQTYKRKSPAVAAGLSLIPGLGKFYAGYKYQGISAFLINTLLFLPVAESYRKTGPKSLRFGLTTGLFGVFYLGNIYGSYAAAKKRNKDFYDQIHHEITQYYLYPSLF